MKASKAQHRSKPSNLVVCSFSLSTKSMRAIEGDNAKRTRTNNSKPPTRDLRRSGMRPTEPLTPGSDASARGASRRASSISPSWVWQTSSFGCGRIRSPVDTVLSCSITDKAHAQTNLSFDLFLETLTAFCSTQRSHGTSPHAQTPKVSLLQSALLVA